MAEAEDRTEAATPRRLQTAREEGNFALSREVTPAAVLALAMLVTVLVLPSAAAHLAGVLTELLQGADGIEPRVALRAAGVAALPVVLPFAAAGLLAAFASALGQTGFSVRLAALQPSLKRLNLWHNLSRIAGGRALLELVRSVLKAGLAGFAIWRAWVACLPLFAVSLVWSPGALLAQAGRLALRLMLAACAAQVVVAAVDLGWTRWSHARSLRMNRQELRDEMREVEGDPQIKARIRRIRLTRARKRMLAAVPKATVVVTNPTHYAVALFYERGGGGAPRVVAKGVDEVAARIRELAEKARVPLVVNPPLARALWALELDSEIPTVMFQAVAAIIAYVWRLRTPARRP
jgi:flagellar biosynthetic protein FlhB